MEAALLMLDVAGIGLVLIWAARGCGTSGWLAWRGDKVPETIPQKE
jgi:hypothetical protein